MKIISKNMIVTTIPSGGANVNLFFALFPRADKMLIGSIIASGFRDKKHSRNDAEYILCPPQNCISRVGNSDIHLSS